jgi:hypothetical protein
VPETKASAEEYQKISEGQPAFYDPEVLEDRI